MATNGYSSVGVCVDYELITYDSSFDISYEWKRKMWGVTQIGNIPMPESSLSFYDGAVYCRPRYRRVAGTVRGCPTTLLAVPRPALSKEV
jgi:hypothetical protein